MKLNVYIIKQGTPESKLLSQAGFDRSALPVSSWKGARRSRGGFGKSPAAWRIEGEDNIRKLCSGITSILGRRPSETLTSEEKSALKRAIRTLAALDNKSEQKERSETVSMNRESVISRYFSRQFPSASDPDVRLVSSTISQNSWNSIQEINAKATILLNGKVDAWRGAVKLFVEAGKV